MIKSENILIGFYFLMIIFAIYLLGNYVINPESPYLVNNRIFVFETFATQGGTVSVSLEICRNMDANVSIDLKLAETDGLSYQFSQQNSDNINYCDPGVRVIKLNWHIPCYFPVGEYNPTVNIYSTNHTTKSINKHTISGSYPINVLPAINNACSE